MSPVIVRRWLALAALGLALVAPAHARTLGARIERVTTAAAMLRDVQVTLTWPAQAQQGALRLRAAHLDAPDLGYALRALDWQCTLTRERAGWHCDGPLRSAHGSARLVLAFDDRATRAEVRRGDTRIALRRDARTPDLTRIDLTAVPLAWAQALTAQAWPEGRLGAGRLDARLQIAAPTAAPLRVRGPLTLRDAAFDTPDGLVAGQNLTARLELDLRFGARDEVRVQGTLERGELLFGNAYVAPQRPVALSLEARSDSGAWRVPRFEWSEGDALRASGAAGFGADGGLRALSLQARSTDLAALQAGYLSGWLGVAGLGELKTQGAFDLRLDVDAGALVAANARLHDVRIDDPRGRFGFDGLDGEIAYSTRGAAPSAVAWRGGRLYGLEFGPTRLPLASGDGVLRLREPVEMAILGGRIGFDAFELRPPRDGQGLDVRFGLSLAGLEVQRLAQALGWPAFGGELSGRIPQARYANDRLEFDGGLSMSVFDGQVRVASLAMERPFGTAPTLSADIELDGLDLHALTGVFDFGSITGRLDGRIGGLRLVDWTPVAFDARLQTRRVRGVPQRISQRAVQSISSVGDASLVTTLQGQLIRLFDDFGYRRIGLACRLVDEVCEMDGLGSAGTGFIIVEGAGVPRLTVIGFNRRVDWPTLVERLAAAGQGDVSPVVE
ncbi:MAG TPA: hypothetical protein VEY50_09860 [Lysobacter sp.]|nr:hypothetical protein [Lysobacter sp.]